MKYSMMVLDLDGTVLNGESQLEAATKTALLNSMKLGKKVVLCSSRSYQEMHKIIAQLYEGCRDQYCIGFGGACVYDLDGRCIIQSDPIPQNAADHMIARAKACRIHIQGYDDSMLYYYDNTLEFRKFIRFADVEDIPMQQISYEEFRNRSYLKLMCLGDIRKLEAYNALIAGDADTSFSNPAGQQGYLDILRAGVSKGTGVAALCRYLHIPLEQCICVGDGDNDISMLRLAGLGAAMKNGSSAAKEAADYVLPYTNNEGAIPYLVERFF